MRGAILSIAILSAVALAGAGPARAQSNPGDLDCKAPQTQMAMNLCAGHAYQAADEELNRVWADLRARRGEGHSWDPILEAQRLWIPFRDAHCEAVAAPYEGGSIQPLIRSSCLTDVTEQRTAQLREFLQEP